MPPALGVSVYTLQPFPYPQSCTVPRQPNTLHHHFISVSLSHSPSMDQALRGKHWSIEEARRGIWMWSTKCTPILSTFEFNGHKKKRKKKDKIISPNLFERNDEIYCCRPLGDLFSSLRRVKCVLTFFLFCFFVFFPVLLFKCMDREWHPPHYSLKKKKNIHAICCPVLSWTGHIYWYVCKISIKAVLLLTHSLFVNTSVCLLVRDVVISAHREHAAVFFSSLRRDIWMIDEASLNSFLGNVPKEVSWISLRVSVHTNTSQYWLLSRWCSDS